MTISEYALVTLGELRDYPGLSNAPSSDDAVLEALIDSASQDIEAYVGNALIRRSFTDYYPDRMLKRYGYDKIRLRYYPISSVSSIVDPAGNTVSSDLYWVDPQTEHLRGSFNIPLDSNGFATYWIITYTAGRWVNTEAVPANYKAGCKMEVAGRYKRPDRDVSSKSVGDLSITYRARNQSGEDMMSPLLESVMRTFDPIRRRDV